MKIVVLGYIVRGPLGGLCWHYMQYVLCLKQLGHEVLYLEDSDDFPSCYNPQTYSMTKDPSYGITFITNLFNQFDLGKNWCYYNMHDDTWYGLEKQKVTAFCDRASLVINISNVTPLRDWWQKIPARVLIDTDPGFTQIRHNTNPRYRAIAAAHTHYFTFGENFGKPGCRMPADGFDWKPTRQPVELGIWSTNQFAPNGNWTTVMQWDSYKTEEFEKLNYGMKSASFSPYLMLPGLVEEKLEMALGGESTPIEALKDNGWQISDPLSITKTPESFRQYIHQSKGEFSVAKQGYVISRSGWFSERSAAYLASGKPVITQETGFTDWMATGKGIAAFSTVEEAVDNLNDFSAHYRMHSIYAKEIAHSYFNGYTILQSLLQSLT